MHFALLGLISRIFIYFYGANKCQKSRPTVALPSALGGLGMVTLSADSHLNAISSPKKAPKENVSYADHRTYIRPISVWLSV
jgi:hypothetical protein